MAINRRHIDKVYGQKFSLLDQKMLEKYFEDNDLNEEAKQVVKAQWEQFHPEKDTPQNLDHVFHKLYYAISNYSGPSSKSIKLNFRIVQIAAILVVGILIAASLYLTRRHVPTVENQQVEFISTSGFRNHFKLPDGTSGWLGADSEVKYHLDQKNQRIVSLNGLAFFDVVHNNSPFIVKTPKNLNIEVKGTRFNVSAYSSDPSCEVVLEKGSVWLSNNRGLKEEMTPNDRVVFHPEMNKLEKSKVNTYDFLAWIDGKLVMKDVPLKEACLKLSRFYNVEIEVNATGIEREKVRLVLEDESLDDALKLLSVIAPVSCRIQERKAQNNDSYSKRKVFITNKQPM
ncbi:FecR family protein [Gaoshiqia sediminis]|uniref:FecR domain-containing protein n=1 Tax=Gaoshiqia sediminis TaxID=2986998 RepID=A0AA41Y9X1_9BACT|nr:FecR domain-containing protein [Gaoshiqia sediminis]MCW0484884.1 FecR domain-containing protein [Gaoshiqia sediminis]